jgi:hypothetical protein
MIRWSQTLCWLFGWMLPLGPLVAQAPPDWILQQVPGVSQYALYQRLKTFYATEPRHPACEMLLDEPNQGRFIYQGVIEYRPSETSTLFDNFRGWLVYTLTMEIKDERYRYRIEKLRHVSNSKLYDGGMVTNEKPECGTFMMSLKRWQTIQQEALQLQRQFEQRLNSTLGASNNDW